MEVSRKRILQKHLEPARPLRRCVHIVNESPAAPAQVMMCHEVLTQTNKKLFFIGKCMTNIGIKQFCKIANSHEEKKGRISYTRDFLIALASCPEAKKRPDFLPEHPIVLSEARDLGHLRLHEMRMTAGKKCEMVA